MIVAKSLECSNTLHFMMLPEVSLAVSYVLRLAQIEAFLIYLNMMWVTCEGILEITVSAPQSMWRVLNCGNKKSYCHTCMALISILTASKTEKYCFLVQLSVAYFTTLSQLLRTLYA